MIGVFDIVFFFFFKLGVCFNVDMDYIFLWRLMNIFYKGHFCKEFYGDSLLLQNFSKFVSKMAMCAF